jgi:pimeloyl-ACP methyl ester carboxylesterase
MPDAELVAIPNSRHATPLDQPEIFNEIVSEFLMQHS